MTFGYDYNDNGEDADDSGENDAVMLDPEHPASLEQCDHLNCKNESPGPQRICDACDKIMLGGHPSECTHCGTSIRD